MLKTPISISIKTNREKHPIKISINNEIMDVWYNDTHIWHESLDEATSLFGVESVTTISEITFLIDNGNDSWKSRVYREKT
jgi:hypothetical protein